MERKSKSGQVNTKSGGPEEANGQTCVSEFIPRWEGVIKSKEAWLSLPENLRVAVGTKKPLIVP